MSTPNTLAQRPKFSVAINTEVYQKLIRNTLGDPDRAKRFVAAITSAVAVNPQLQECEAGSILAGALLGESLGLSPSPQLGQYYLVPFKQKAKYRDGQLVQPECTKATFVPGYKGYIQLALRSGQYRKLNVLEIKQGELIDFDPLNEVIECKLIDDFDVRENTPTIGYYAMFEYLNGFRKAIYWTKEKMLSHADKYSPAFSKAAYKKLQAGEIPNQDLWRYSSFWYTGFDDMAKKTMLRHLISRWGIMSIEFQQILSADNEVVKISDDGEIVVPAGGEITPAEPEITNVVEGVNLDDL